MGEVFRMSNESFLCVLALQIKAFVFAFYEMACVLKASIARYLGHETPLAIKRGNLKSDRDAKVYRDLYGHSRKMANISLRLKENKNVQLNP